MNKVELIDPTKDPSTSENLYSQCDGRGRFSRTAEHLTKAQLMEKIKDIPDDMPVFIKRGLCTARPCEFVRMMLCPRKSSPHDVVISDISELLTDEAYDQEEMQNNTMKCLVIGCEDNE